MWLSPDGKIRQRRIVHLEYHQVEIKVLLWKKPLAI
jgi:hypothetical protein